MGGGGVGNNFSTCFISFSRWYLLVIVLLYIGLITSFCLNVTLLVRREPERVVRLEEMARTGTGSLLDLHNHWPLFGGLFGKRNVPTKSQSISPGRLLLSDRGTLVGGVSPH